MPLISTTMPGIVALTEKIAQQNAEIEHFQTMQKQYENCKEIENTKLKHKLFRNSAEVRYQGIKVWYQGSQVRSCCSRARSSSQTPILSERWQLGYSGERFTGGGRQRSRSNQTLLSFSLPFNITSSFSLALTYSSLVRCFIASMPF